MRHIGRLTGMAQRVAALSMLALCVACALLLACCSPSSGETEEDSTDESLLSVEPVDAEDAFTQADPSSTYSMVDDDGMWRQIVANYKKDSGAVSVISLIYEVNEPSTNEATEEQLQMMKDQIEAWQSEYGDLENVTIVDRTTGEYSYPGAEIRFADLDDPENAKYFDGDFDGLELDENGLINIDDLRAQLDEMGLNHDFDFDPSETK